MAFTAALPALTKAPELAPVRTNMIAPGLVETRFGYRASAIRWRRVASSLTLRCRSDVWSAWPTVTPAGRTKMGVHWDLAVKKVETTLRRVCQFLVPGLCVGRGLSGRRQRRRSLCGVPEDSRSPGEHGKRPHRARAHWRSGQALTLSAPPL